MAIEPKDLRLGNKVMVSHKVVTIESIDEQGINSTTSGGYYPGDWEIEYEARFGGTSFWKNYPEPESIPLTPEILLACGFTHRPGSDVLMLTIAYEDGDYPCTLQKTGDGIQICRSGIGAITAHINSLHQLQNLYHSLTGRELVYSPPKTSTN